MDSSENKLIHSLICFGIVMLLYFSSYFIFMFSHNLKELISSGYATSLAAIITWLPLSIIAIKQYSRYYDDIKFGNADFKSILFFGSFTVLLYIISTFYPQPELWLDSVSSYSKTAFILFSISTCILAPIYEEIMFRGFMLNSFILWGPRMKTIGIVCTSMIFSSIHYQNNSPTTFIYLFIFSVILCYARIHKKGLAVPIVLHGINNSWSIFLLLLSR